MALPGGGNSILHFFPANQAAYLLAYQILVFIVAPLLAVLATLLAAAVWAAPVSILTRRRNSSRYATLCHAVVTFATCIVSIVGAALGTVEHMWKEQWFHMQMVLCVSFAQGIDGYFTWTRYTIVFPEWTPSKLQRVGVHAFILLFLFMPFLSTAVFWSPSTADTFDSVDTPPMLTFFSIAWYFSSIPARILWDVLLGCSMLTRIHELRLALVEGEAGTEASATQQQNTALIALARNTIVYIGMSAVFNVFIHLPLLHVLPFVAVFVMLYTFTFALASHFCFNSRRDLAIPRFLRFLILSGDTSQATEIEQGATATAAETASSGPTAVGETGGGALADHSLFTIPEERERSSLTGRRSQGVPSSGGGTRAVWASSSESGSSGDSNGNSNASSFASAPRSRREAASSGAPSSYSSATISSPLLAEKEAVGIASPGAVRVRAQEEGGGGGGGGGVW